MGLNIITQYFKLVSVTAACVVVGVFRHWKLLHLKKINLEKMGIN